MEKPKKLTTKKLIAIIAAVFLVCGCALGLMAYLRNSVEEVVGEDNYGYVNPDETKAETDAGFVIDGVLDEEQYQKNNWLYLSNKEGGADVDIAMTSYYGDKGMYFVYDVTEGNPIYVNTTRSSYMNSCVEMYLAPNTLVNRNQNSVFEIDLLPTGDMTFKKSNGKGGYTNVATTDDLMAVLGTTTKGGEVNTEDCYGYCLELFIPWEYMDKFDLDADAMKDSYVYVNPAHITSFNYEGTDANVDRYWYHFAQQHGAGLSNVYQYYRFDEDGVQGTVPVELQAGEHYTIEGGTAVIPGMKTNVTITPEEGYALNSILINGEEYITKANFNADGSVTINERGVKDGMKISASAVLVTEGNKTLSGTVIANKLGGGSLKNVSASYNGPTGERPLELDSKGKFTLTDLKQGYYTITIEKEGYEKLVRSIYLNRDMEVELSLEYQAFVATGASWILDDQNDGMIYKFGGSGNLLSNDKYNKFTVEATFKYDKEAAEVGDDDIFSQQRQGIKVAFSNEKTWHVDILYQDSKYIVQYAKHSGANSLTGWRGIYEMTDAEAAKLTGEDGVKLSIQRDGKYANVYLDGKLIAVEVLDDEFSKCTAQIGFEAWAANREVVEIPYKITTTTSVNLKDTLFKMANGWDVSGQYDGLITMPEGGRGNLQFAEKKANMNLTLRVRDYQNSTDEAGIYPRTDVLFVFDNGAHISFGITSDENGARVQSLNNAANTVDGKSTQYIYKRWTEWGPLTDEEFEQYKKDGVDFRIVRYGTEITLYIGDRMVAVADLTNNDSGVTADMPATVTIRHYDDAGVKVEMPFELTDEYDFVKITTIPGKNGSVATEKQQYFVGDTVKVMAEKDDYYATWMKVNGKEVPIDWDLTYSFTATEKEYTVEGEVAKKVFEPSEEWNLLKQNEGKLIVPNSDGDSNWVKTSANTYKDVDMTVTLIDQKSEDKNFRTAVRFYFTNGETVTFTVTNDTKDGSYILQNMNGTILNWLTTGYTLSAEQAEKITNGEGLKMRILRIGSGVDVYFEDEHAYGFDLSKNIDGEDSEVEDVTAQIGIRHFGNTGVDAVIPFEFAEAEEPIKITIKDSKNGTAATKQMHYYAGQTVIASGKGDEGYYCTGLEVDGEKVTLNWDGTYSFEAKKEGHTLKGSFSERIFKDNSAWDLVEQNKNYKVEDGAITADGVIALPNGGNGGWLEFYNKYTDMDLTLKVRDDQNSTDQGSKWPRTDVLFLFDVDGDGKYNSEKDVNVSFGVTTNANGAWIQSLNNDADAKNPNRIYDIYDAHGDLTPEEYQQFKEDGVEFRIVRKGTDIHLYIGDRKVNVRDIAEFHQNSTYEGATNTTGATGITADTPATVYIRHYDDAGVENLEFAYSVTEVMPENAIINIDDNIENGTITTQLDINKYLVGDRVALIPTGEGDYYYDSLKANDKDVKVDENSLLPTFKAKAENEVTGSFAAGVLTTRGKWSLLNHNVGILALANPSNSFDYSGWADTKDSAYRGVTVTAKNMNSNIKDFGVAIHFAFDNGESFRLRLHNTDSDGKYRIQTMNGDTLFANWQSPYTLDEDEVEKVTGEEGIEFRVAIVGKEAHVYLDGKTVPACSFDLSKNQSGKDSGVGSSAAKVSVRLYGNTGHSVLMPYELERVKLADVRITNLPADGGAVQVLNEKNYVDGSVTLKPVAKDGYGCTGLKVNGSPVKLDTDGTYTFTAKDENTVEATFNRKVILNINVPTDSAYGTITAKKDYYVGQTVELVVDTADGYNCKDFVVKHGDNEVLSEKVIFADGTYSFKADKYNYTIEGSFVEKKFNDNANWDLTSQYDGVISVPKDAARGSRLDTKKSAYKDMELMVRDYTPEDENFKLEIRFKFEKSGEWKFRLENSETEEHNYRVQSMDCTFTGWNPTYNLNEEETEAIKSEDGIKFRAAIVGKYAKIYLNGKEVYSIDISKDKNNGTSNAANEAAQISLWSRGGTGYDVEIPFTLGGAPETATVNIADGIENGTITKNKDSYIVGEKVTLTVAGSSTDYYYNSLTINGEEVMVENDGTYTFTATEEKYDVNGSFASSIFKTDRTGNYWYTNQHKGIMVVRDTNTGGAGWLGFKQQYTNVDISLMVKVDADDDQSRTSVRFVFEDNTHITFSVLRESGQYRISGSKENGYGNWANYNNLTSEEVKLLTGEEGLEFRVVRDGTKVDIYVNGNLQYGGIDLTNRKSGTASIAENAPMTVYINRENDAGDLVEIPFTISSSLPEQVNITTETDNEGTISLSKENANGEKVAIDANNPLVVGQKVTVSVAGVDKDYYYDSLIIKDEISGKEESVTVDNNGEYTFTATSTQYKITASFAKTRFLVNNDTLTWWNLTNQHKGIIVHRDTHSTDKAYIDFDVSCANSDVTITIKDHVDKGKAGFRTAIGYYSSKVNKGFSILKEGEAYWLSYAWGAHSTRLYKLSDAETEMITKGDGIEFRVVKVGNTVSMYVDGILRDTHTLTELGNTDKTNIWIKQYDDVGALVEMPFTMSATAPDKVTINISDDIANGTVTTDKQTNAEITDKSYIVGEKVTLKPTANSGYEFNSLSVDGEEVELSADGTYTFTATKTSYEVTATFIEDAPFVALKTLSSPEGMFFSNTKKTSVADPFVLDNTDVDGYYYMYGTYGSYGLCYCYRSEDMVNWTKIGSTLELTSDAEKTAVSADIWAPEVVYEDATDDGVNNGTYYMFFSASTSDGITEMLYVAVSDRPDGGFKLVDFTDESSCGTGNKHGYSTNAYTQEYAKYMMLDPELYKKFSDKNKASYESSKGENYKGYVAAIDPHPYVAANGDKYLFWVDSRGSDRICGVKMNNWLSPDWGTATVLTYHGYYTVEEWKKDVSGENKTAAYELQATINEGPVITEHNGKVYLTFSVNDYRTNDYQVIQAVSSNGILGDYRKLTEEEGGILLSGTDTVTGTGHHSFVTVGEQTYIVYHRHNDIDASGYSRNHAIDEIKWVTIKDKDGNDLEIMTVNGPTSTEQPMIEAFSKYQNIADDATVTGSSDASYLNDGLFSLNKYSNETSINKRTTFTFNFEEVQTVSAIMIYNSKLADTCFDKITKIELVCEESKGTVVRYIEDLEAMVDANGSIIPGAASYAAFEDAKVVSIRITVEVPEGQDSVGITEVKILSPKSK